MADLVRIDFRGKTVEFRTDLQQHSVKRALVNVMGLEVVSGSMRGGIWGSESLSLRSDEAPEARRNESRSGDLRDTGHEIAPAQLKSKVPLRPAQRSFSREVTCRAKLTFVN